MIQIKSYITIRIPMPTFTYVYRIERESGRVSDANTGALNLHPKEEHIVVVTHKHR